MALGATNSPKAQGDIIAIDHLAAIVGDGELLSVVLYWVALFEMTKSAQTDRLDPGGVVHGEAIESADQQLRLTLNGWGGNQTLASRFMQNFPGSGFQHIAFDTNDIFALAARLRASGLELLPIPDNYYDEVASRHGLAAGYVDRLRQKRLFFEFVQRGDYRGYGAPNTQVRLTAQARYRDRPSFD